MGKWNKLRVRVFILILHSLFISCEERNKLIVSELEVNKKLYALLVEDIKENEKQLENNDTCFLSVMKRDELFHLYFTFENANININDEFWGYFYCRGKLILYLKDKNNINILSDLFKINYNRKISLSVLPREDEQTNEENIFIYDPIWFEYEYKIGILNRVLD